MNGSKGVSKNPNQAEYVALEPGREDYFDSDKPRVMIAGGPADGNVDVGIPLFALVEMEVPAYESDKLPAALAAIPAVKPGSRSLQ